MLIRFYDLTPNNSLKIHVVSHIDRAQSVVEFKWGCLPTTVSEMGDCKIVYIYMYISSLTLFLLNHTLSALPSLSKFCHFGAETKSSVIHSHKGFFVKKLVRFGGKKLLKLPYLDNRFQQICQNIVRFLNFPLWPVAKFDELPLWLAPSKN